MTLLRHSRSVVIARSAEDVYDMVADVTRMGEWSPVCQACWWDEADAPQPGQGPRVGAWFTGRNEEAGGVWETRSQVVEAERGKVFTFVVGGSLVRWSYTFSPEDGATEVTETWEFLPEGIAHFHDRYGDDAPARIAARAESARIGVPTTLANLKAAAEAS